MNLWDRFRNAFSGEAKQLERTAASLIETWRTNQPVYTPLKFENLVRHGWRKNELIFACVSKTANTAAQVGMQVFPIGGDVPIKDHPLKKLLQKPNRYMTEFDFWASIIIYHKLFGRCYFEKQRDGAGNVIALWPLRPDWVYIIPKSAIEIDYYQYKPDGVTEPARLEVENVLDLKMWDPLGMYETWSPVAVAARIGDVDNATTDFLKMFFQKGGAPPGLLKTMQKLSEAQVEIIRQRWTNRYGGYENWQAPAVLDSDASYQRVGLTFREMGFEQLDARNEARICMVIDIPPILVGAKVGLDRSTYSNYREARASWWEDTLVPMYVNLNDGIQNQLVPDFGGNVEVRWNFSGVPALQEERNSRWKRATDAFNAGAITINEFRVEIGLSPVGPKGDVYIRNPAFVEIPLPGTDEMKARRNGYHVHELRAPDDSERRAFEEQLTRVMREYLEGQVERIQQELGTQYADR